MNTLHLFFSDAFIQALGWVLVHSLWQATILALLVWAVRPQLSSTLQRYWVAYGALCLQWVAAVITFWAVYSPALQLTPFTQSEQIILVPEDGVYGTGTGGLTDGFEQYSAWIVGVWIAGMVLSVSRLGGSLYFLYRQKKRAIPLAGSYWSEKTTALARQMGYSRAVGLLESVLVKTPMTLGYLKPVILLPLGLVNRLTPAEVEAVLAHELAHIARRDWLFNLIQTVLETLFYYHPAVWWLSGIIRTEREHCCDDKAVRLTGSALLYVKTLVRLQEAAPAVPALAVTGNSSWLLKRRKPLLERAQRILQPSPLSSSPMEKTLAIIIVLVLFSVWKLQSNSASQFPTAVIEAVTELSSNWQEAQLPAADSVPPRPKQTQRIVRDDGKQRVELEMENGRPARLAIDGKEVPQNELPNHQALIDELRRDMPPPPPPPGRPAQPGMPAYPEMPGYPAPPTPPAPTRIINEKDNQGNTVIRIEKPGGDMKLVIKEDGVWLDDRKLAPGEEIPMIMPMEMEQSILIQGAEEDQERFMHHQERLAHEQERLAREQIYINEEEIERINAEVQVEVERAMRQAKGDMKRAEKERRRAERDMQRAHREGEHAHNLGSMLKGNLLRDKLIKDPNNFDFSLSEKEMKIDGKVQSAEVHQRYLKLYREHSDDKKVGTIQIQEHRSAQ